MGGNDVKWMKRAGCMLLALLLTASAALAEGGLADWLREQVGDPATDAAASPEPTDRPQEQPEEAEPAETASPEAPSDAADPLRSLRERLLNNATGKLTLHAITLENLSLRVDDTELPLSEGLSVRLSAGTNAGRDQAVVGVELLRDGRQTGMRLALDSERAVLLADALEQPVVLEYDSLTSECFRQSFLPIVESALLQVLPDDRRNALYALFEAWPDVLREQENPDPAREKAQAALDQLIGQLTGEARIEERWFAPYEFRYGGTTPAHIVEFSMPDWAIAVINQLNAELTATAAERRFSQAWRQLIAPGIDWAQADGQLAGMSFRQASASLGAYDLYPITDEIQIDVGSMSGQDGQLLLSVLYLSEDDWIGDWDARYVDPEGGTEASLRVWVSAEGSESPDVNGTISAVWGDETATGTIQAGTIEKLPYFAGPYGEEETGYFAEVRLDMDDQTVVCSYIASDRREFVGADWYGASEWQAVSVGIETDPDTGERMGCIDWNTGGHSIGLFAELREEQPELLDSAAFDEMISAGGMSLWSVGMPEINRLKQALLDEAGELPELPLESSGSRGGLSEWFIDASGFWRSLLT